MSRALLLTPFLYTWHLTAQLLDVAPTAPPSIRGNKHAFEAYLITPDTDTILGTRKRVADLLKQSGNAELINIELHGSDAEAKLHFGWFRSQEEWNKTQRDVAGFDWRVAVVTRSRARGTFRYRNGTHVVIETLPGYQPERWTIDTTTFTLLYLPLDNSRWHPADRPPYAHAYLQANADFTETNIRDLLIELRRDYYSGITGIAVSQDIACFAADYAAMPFYYWFDATQLPERAQCRKRVVCRRAVRNGVDIEPICYTTTGANNFRKLH